MASRKEFACLSLNLDHANRFQCKKSTFQDCRNLISAYMSPTTEGSLMLSNFHYCSDRQFHRAVRIETVVVFQKSACNYFKPISIYFKCS